MIGQLVLPPSPTANQSSRLTSPGSSPSKRNKRKSMEPKRVAQANMEDNSKKILQHKRPRLESDGEEHNATPSPRLPSLSPGSSECRSPSPTATMASIASSMAPKKRFKQEALKDLENNKSKNPFRPWDSESSSSSSKTLSSSQAKSTTVREPSVIDNQASPWALAAAYTQDPRLLLSAFLSQAQHPGFNPASLPLPRASIPAAVPTTSGPVMPVQDEPLALVVPKKTEQSIEENHDSSMSSTNSDRDLGADHDQLESQDGCRSKPKAKQRNYKNMTRERRVEANARERQRVHTITAAFDTLQNSIPVDADAKGSKMSKLSIIKIATSYIMCLSRECGYDYSADKSAPSLENCRKQLEDLIRTESKSQHVHTKSNKSR